VTDGAGDQFNKSSGQGDTLYCGNRNSAKYGNGALILEGYRVNYIDETIKERNSAAIKPCRKRSLGA
jgi:hypothetical protein